MAPTPKFDELTNDLLSESLPRLALTGAKQLGKAVKWLKKAPGTLAAGGIITGTQVKDAIAYFNSDACEQAQLPRNHQDCVHVTKAMNDWTALLMSGQLSEEEFECSGSINCQFRNPQHAAIYRRAFAAGKYFDSKYRIPKFLGALKAVMPGLGGHTSAAPTPGLASTSIAV